MARYEEDFYAGMPAITQNQYGKGHTYYLGTNMNHEGIAKVLDLAVQSAGVAPVIPEQTVLEITCRKNNNQAYYFILNFKNKDIEIPACFAGSTDLLTGAVIEAGKTLKQYDSLLVCVAE